MFRITRNTLVVVAAAVLAAGAYSPLADAVRFTHVANPQEHPTNDEPFPSPDGTEIVIESNLTGKQQLWIVSKGGRLVRRLTHDQGVDDTPTWSHDGRNIAYLEIENDRTALSLIAVDGHRVRRIANDGLDYLHPTWSPDDRWIMYNVNSLRYPTTYELWAMRTDGTQRHAITHNASSETTYGSWSPDGRHIVFRRKFPPYRSQVYVADADGSHQRNLSSTDSYDGWPSWSPDGRSIVFSSNRLERGRGSLNMAVFVMKADGSHVREISRTSGRNTEPRFSPDGKTVYFSHCEHHACDVYAADLPLSGS